MSAVARKSKAAEPQTDTLLREVSRARSALCLFDLSLNRDLSPSSLGLISEYLNDGEFHGYVKAMAVDTLAKALNSIETLRRAELQKAVA